jgi:hypothetical protein
VSKSDDDATAASSTRKGGSQLESRAALLFGLVGMLTGVVGLVFAYQAQHEQQIVSFAAYPSASVGDLTPAGLGVRVRLENQSLRPVIVSGASLWQRRARLASASGYVSDSRILDSAEIDPSQLTGRLANLPLNIGAREGRSVALLLDVWNGVSEDPGAQAKAARAHLNDTLNALEPVSAGTAPLTLELDLVPGGIRRFRLQPLPARTAEAATTASSSWEVSPLGSPPKLIGLLLRNSSAGVGAVELVRLDLWKDDSTLHRSMTRPVLGQQATAFPLVDLPRGSYAAAFQLDGQVIANRSFSIPWPREPCAVGLQQSSASALASSAAWC